MGLNTIGKTLIFDFKIADFVNNMSSGERERGKPGNDGNRVGLGTTRE